MTRIEAGSNEAKRAIRLLVTGVDGDSLVRDGELPSMRGRVAQIHKAVMSRFDRAIG
jgi:hypothetical protein